MRAWMPMLLLLTLGRTAGATAVLVDEDFSHFAGAGVAPGAGAPTLDSRAWAVTGFSDGDSAFGAVDTTGDLARGRSPGGVRTGGLYAFDLPGGSRGLGVQATGSDFTPGGLHRRVSNATDAALAGLRVVAELWVLNDGARSTGVRLAADRGSFPHDDGAVELLSTPGPADGAGWQPRVVDALLDSVPLAAGESVILSWLFDDRAGTGGRDEIALSRLEVQGLVQPAPAPPRLGTPGAAVLLAPGLLVLLGRRRALRIVNATARRA